MYKKSSKIIASLIVFIMLITNMSTVGIHVGEVIAANSELDTQTSKTNNPNVEFDTFFEEGNKTHEGIKNIGEENKIVAQISVKNAGYLRDARIEFVEPNFETSNNINAEDKVSKIENNVIFLNQIDNGENVSIELPIEFKHSTQVNIAQFDKTSTVKFTGTYVDENGKARNIKKDITLDLKWTANAEAEVTSQISKYVPYDINGQKGLILQMLVKSSVKDNILPVKENVIEIEAPKINNIYPTNVTVYNQDNNVAFENNYDENTNKLTIISRNNANEANEIYWSNNIADEYIVTYIYPETALTEEEITTKIQASSNIKVYSYNEQTLISSYENTVTLKDKIGEVVDYEIIATEKLTKGYMYANYNSTEKTETNYTEIVKTNIDLPQLIDEITLNMGVDKFDKETATGMINTYYKNIRIAKSEFNKFFGEEGFIKIYSGENLVATIDNTLEQEEIVLELNVETLTIKTSKPVVAGELTLELEKAIKGELTYNKQEVETFESINIEANMSVKNGETEIVNKNVNAQIKLEQPVLETELVVSNTNLSTILTNENVEIRAILKTDSEYNKLYENPTVVINLPSYIENINIKNAKLMFDEELTMGEPKLIQNADGSKQIVIELSGVQTKYSLDSAYKGANIVITADITVNNLTPNKEAEIKMTTINGNEQVETTSMVNFIAPMGIVTVNKISNFAQGSELVALTSDEKATLEVTTSAKNATAEIQVINNYSNIINNIQILGRTLASGTTDTDSDESLNNTFDAPMLGAINTNGMENVSIYYSTNGSATNDLNNPENNWTTEVTDFSTVKSYLIVLNDYTMNIGDTVKFTYDVQIPENLNYSEKVSSVYTVHFDNVQEEQTIRDYATARTLTLETGVAPELEVNLSSYSVEESTVREGQYVKFIATVTNTGTIDAQNVRLNVTAPSENIYAYEDENGEVILTKDASIFENPEEYLAITYITKHTEFVQENYYTGYRDSEEKEKTIEIGTVKAGETIEIEYEIKIDNVKFDETKLFLEENSKLPEVIMSNMVRVIADDMQKEVASNEYNLKVEDGQVSIILQANSAPDNILTKGDELKYNAQITQINSTGAIKNVVVTVKIPSGLVIKNAILENYTYTTEEIKYTLKINGANNTAEFTIEELKVGDKVGCIVTTEVGDMIGEITPDVRATIDGKDTHYGNIIKNTVSKLDFEIVQSNLDNPYVKENENLTFEYKITNTSDVYCDDFVFENVIPEGMQIVGVQIVTDDETSTLKNYSQEKLVINRTFKAGQTIIIRVIVKAVLLETGETQKEITNYATISGSKFETKQSNSVKATIEYNEEAHKNPNNPDEETNTKKLISGIAWLDKNQDGERNEGEEVLPGIEVRLLNKATNETLKTTKTSSSGEYIFTELEAGDYLVVFVYNSYKYELTQYKKTGVSQSTNSDVINVNMEIDGVETVVAISDTIRISNSNIRNIDIGLIESEKSDLKLDKYISGITLTYGNTTKTYDYENAKLAKVEIPAKNLSNATVIVEYKIVVTNEGAIGNYVKKIVDYIPKDMKFNAELNRDWYQSTNGDIYNSSLSNTKLESGETREVTLVLTKNMTDSNVGIVNNNAELYEVYNEEGIADIDSTPANKVSGEDDMSAADVVISVKTGDAILYTVIISSIICVAMGISIYYIRKKVLRKI